MTATLLLPSQLPDVGNRIVVWDTETSGLHPEDLVVPIPLEGEPCARVSTVSVAWLDDNDEPQAYAWAFDQGIRDKLYQPSMLEMLEDPNLPESEWLALMAWLSAPGRRLCAHNAKFDLHMTCAGTRHWLGKDLIDNVVWDTAIGQKILDPIEFVRLKETAQRLGIDDGGEKSSQDVLLNWVRKAKLGKGIGTKDNPRYDLAPWAVMERYAREDAKLTLLLFLLQQERLFSGEGSIRRFRRQMELMADLYKMERRGIGFDAEACLATSLDVKRQIADLSADLPFTPTLAHAKHYFFNVKGIEPTKTTEKKGDPQLDDEVRTHLIGLGIAGAKEYDQIVRLENADSRWYTGWPQRIGPDGRLRTVFRQVQVKSGRMSVERVQLHAVPKDGTLAEGIPSVRQFFRPKPGHALWNMDLSQAELRAAAYEANCRLMLKMLNEGADMHGITTLEVFGVAKGHPDFKVKRDVAKRLNFGGIFQIGGRKFQATLAKEANLYWTLDECEEAVGRWRNMYPEFGRAYYRWMKMAERNGWIYLVDDEPSYFGPRDFPNSAWNRRVQGSLASYLAKWIIMTERHHPGVQLLTVHDSIVAELPLVPRDQLVPWGEGDDVEMVHPVAADIARLGAEGATRMFNTKMKVDAGLWRADHARCLEEVA